MSRASDHVGCPAHEEDRPNAYCRVKVVACSIVSLGTFFVSFWFASPLPFVQALIAAIDGMLVNLWKRTCSLHGTLSDSG